MKGEFKGAIRGRFRSKSPWDLSEQFFALTQKRTVEEYQERFEALAGNLEHYREAVLEENFIKGLKAEIRVAVKVLKPRDMKKAIEYAQLVENQRQIDRGWRRSHTREPPMTTTTYLAPRGPTWSEPKEGVKEKIAEAWLGGNFKRLTNVKMQEKRAKGLCLRCDEKFAPGHRCKEQTLQALTVYIDEALEEGEGEILEDEV